MISENSCSFFQDQLTKLAQDSQTCENCNFSTTSIIVFLCINAFLMIVIFLWAIRGACTGKWNQFKKCPVLDWFHVIFWSFSEVPYDPMEDEDQSLTTSKTKVIVKLKKKACVCLRESQMNDYNNFVWNLKHFRTNDEKKKKKRTCLKSKIKLSQCI